MNLDRECGCGGVGKLQIKLPDYDLIEESLLFSAALVKIDTGRFDTFVSQDIGEERNVIAAFHEVFRE